MSTRVEKEKFVAALLWLECKQVLRGVKSTLFDDLTKEEAVKIRALGSVDAVQEWLTLSKNDKN